MSKGILPQEYKKVRILPEHRHELYKCKLYYVGKIRRFRTIKEAKQYIDIRRVMPEEYYYTHSIPDKKFNSEKAIKRLEWEENILTLVPEDIIPRENWQLLYDNIISSWLNDFYRDEMSPSVVSDIIVGRYYKFKLKESSDNLLEYEPEKEIK